MALCRQNAFYKSPKHLRANNRNKQSPRFFEYENDIKIYSNAYIPWKLFYHGTPQIIWVGFDYGIEINIGRKQWV